MIVEEPGALRKAQNLGRAVLEHAAGGMKSVTPEEKERRLSSCRGCETYFDPVKVKCLHPSCGCRMSVKAGWQDQHCPIGRW